MKKGSKRSDLLRLRSISQKLVEHLDDEELDELSLEQKLICVFQAEKHPIYRRKILQTTKVYGMWWMSESQWLKFLWQGHQAHIIKTDLDPDKVLCTRSFDCKGYAYIRDMGTHLDIEGMSKVSKWDSVKKRHIGSAYEWLTVSVSREEYQNLVDNHFLGAVDCGCKHHKEDDDRFQN